MHLGVLKALRVAVDLDFVLSCLGSFDHTSEMAEHDCMVQGNTLATILKERLQS